LILVSGSVALLRNAFGSLSADKDRLLLLETRFSIFNLICLLLIQGEELYNLIGIILGVSLPDVREGLSVG